MQLAAHMATYWQQLSLRRTRPNTGRNKVLTVLVVLLCLFQITISPLSPSILGPDTAQAQETASDSAQPTGKSKLGNFLEDISIKVKNFFFHPDKKEGENTDTAEKIRQRQRRSVGKRSEKRIFHAMKRHYKAEEIIQIDLQTQDTNINATLTDPSGKVTPIDQENVEKTDNGSVLAIVQPENFQPGIYTVSISKPSGTTETETFAWGVLTLNTNKDLYVVGETAYLQIGSLDKEGHTICDSNLELKINNQIFSTQDGTIIRNSTCGEDNVTDEPDYYVKYLINSEESRSMTLKNLDKEYEITSTLEVRHETPFSIERIGATRINPFKADYTMTIKVKSAVDYQGKITEQIPADFELINSTNTWDANLVAGTEETFSYTYRAPKISPAIFQLGPLKIGEYTENRQWQLASDAPSLVFDSNATFGTQASGSRRVIRTTNGTNSNRVFVVYYNGTDNTISYSDNPEAGNPTWSTVSTTFGASMDSADMVWDETNNVIYIAYARYGPNNNNNSDIYYRRLSTLGSTPTLGAEQVALNGNASANTYHLAQIEIAQDSSTTKVFVFGNRSASGTNNTSGFDVAVGTINSDTPTWGTYTVKTWTGVANSGLMGVTRLNTNKLVVQYHNGTDITAVRHDDADDAEASTGWDALDGTNNSATTISTDEPQARQMGSVIGSLTSDNIWFGWQDNAADINTRFWNGSSLGTELVPVVYTGTTGVFSLTGNGTTLYLAYINPSDLTQVILAQRSFTDGTSAWSGSTVLLDDLTQNVLHPSTAKKLYQNKVDMVSTSQTNSLIRHSSYITTTSEANFRIQTGYYVGNGADDRAITGIGFSPDLVLIKDSGSEGVNGYIFKTTAMAGDSTAKLPDSEVNGTNLIQSLDSDGFTIGTDPDINTANEPYYWIAFDGANCAPGSTFCVGSYTGTGSTQSITTGFQPDLIVVKRNGASTGVWKTSAMASNATNFFTATDEDTGAQIINSITTTGFSVGTSSRVNTSGDTHWFFAFKQVAGMMDIGTYTGNATDNRNITTTEDAGLTFQPNFVWIKSPSGALPAVTNTSEMYGDRSNPFTDASTASDYIQSLNASGGFQVGASSHVNGSGVTMHHVAFGGAPAHTASGTYQMATGTYAGNGTSQTISGIGFRPDLVIVKHTDQATDLPAVFTTSLMPTDLTATISNNTSSFAGGITSLDATGFSVGSDLSVNASGDTYYWTAFGNAWKPHTATGASDFILGAYIGTGVDDTNITRLPFKPDFITIKRDLTGVPKWRTSEMVGDLTASFDSNAEAADYIQAFTSDGFQVGTQTSVNSGDSFMHYFAFKKSAKFTVGSYTGTGASQTLSTGVGPGMLWVKKASGGTARQAAMRMATMSGDAGLPMSASPLGTGMFTSTYQYGVTLGTNNLSNENTFPYRYAAWDDPTDDPPTAHSFQRKTWYDGSRFWRAYNDPTDDRIEFEYSPDGSSWTENTTARISTFSDTSDFSVHATSSNAYVSYATGNVDHTDDLVNSGLVGYWKMNESSWNGATNEVLDSSGNNFHGTRTGNATTTIGKFGFGGTFDGSGDYITINDNASLRPGSSSWTMAAWINPNNVAQTTGVLQKTNLASGMVYGITISGSIDGLTTGKKITGGMRESAAGDRRLAITTNDIVDGNWHHVALVLDKVADSLTIYVDGVAQSVTTDSAGAWPDITNTDNLVIGSYVVAYDYNGVIDDARIYNRALSAAEVASLGKPGFDIEVRKAASYPGTSFNWNNPTVSFNGSSGLDYYINPVITEDSTGKLWIGSSRNNGGTYTFNAARSTSASDTTAWDTATALDSSSNSNKFGVLVPRTSGNAQAIWIDGTAIESKNYTSGSWDGSPTSIATGLSGIANSPSATSDSSGNVHLAYIDSSGNTKYQEYTSAWQTAVTLDSNSGNSYPSITFDTTASSAYAFWTRGDDIYYKKGNSPYTSGSWDVAATSWQTSGTNTYFSSNFSGANKIFGQWYDGSAIAWDDITIVGNQSPVSPTTLAQKSTSDVVFATGEWVSPTSIKFTALISDADASDTVSLCVEADNISTAFSNTEDLCGTGVAYSGTPVAASVTLTGLTNLTEYHWQARTKDVAGAYSSWVSYGGNSDTTPGAARDFGINTDGKQIVGSGAVNFNTSFPSQRRQVRTTAGPNGKREFAAIQNHTDNVLYYSDNPDDDAPVWSTLTLETGTNHPNTSLVWDETNNVIYVCYARRTLSNNNNADVLYRRVSNLGGSPPTLGAAQTVVNGTAGAATTNLCNIEIAKDAGETKVFVFTNGGVAGGNPGGVAVSTGTINSDSPTWSTAYGVKLWTAAAESGMYGVSRVNSDKLVLFYYDGANFMATQHTDSDDAESASGWDALDGTDNSQTTISSDDPPTSGVAVGSVVGSAGENSIWFSWMDTNQDLNTRRWSGTALDTEMTPINGTSTSMGGALSTDGSNLYLFYRSLSNSVSTAMITRSFSDGTTAWNTSETIIDTGPENQQHTNVTRKAYQGYIDVLTTGSANSIVRHVSVNVANIQAPNTPASLDQKTIGNVSISTGGWTNGSVKFTAQATDGNSSDTLYLCVETDLLGTNFSNIEDTCGSGVAYSGSAVGLEHTIALTDGSEYHWQIRVKDSSGEYSGWVSFGGNAESARDVAIDSSAPTGGNVYDGTSAGNDVNFSDSSISALSANWANFNSNASGLNKYEYSIGTTAGGTDIKTWTDNSTATSVTATSLTLQTSQMYYFNVRAVDNAGNTSNVVSSNGQLVSPSLSFSLSSSSLAFSHLNPSNPTDTETTTLTTSTNAYNGYVIRAFITDYLRSANGLFTIPDFSGGTYASPDGWLSGDTGYGYTSSDITIQGVNKFNPTTCAGGNSSPCYAPFSQTSPGDIVADHTNTVSGTAVSNEQFTITQKVQTSDAQAAQTYNTTVVYTATAQY